MDKKKKFSTFSYKLVQISPIVILVNSGAFLSISSWFCELKETNFCHDTIHFFYWLPPKTQGIMGHVQVANTAAESYSIQTLFLFSSLVWEVHCCTGSAWFVGLGTNRLGFDSCPGLSYYLDNQNTGFNQGV